MDETTQAAEDAANAVEQAAPSLADAAAALQSGDTAAALNLAQVFTDRLVSALPSVIVAVVILVIGFWIAGRCSNWMKKLMAKYDEIDPLLGNFFASILRWVIIAFTLLAVLAKFGIETTSFIAIFGAAGLAVGLALQGTLSNLAAGVMIMIFRPFKIGDFVNCAGQTGSITKVGMFVTEITTPDNIQILLPNGDIWGSAITNFAAHDTRRFDLVYGVGYGADINKAIDVITKVLKAEERVHSDPEPMVAVTNLGESSVDITARAWCARKDFFGLQCDLRKAVKEALDANDVDIPFPTRTLIMENASG